MTASCAVVFAQVDARWQTHSHFPEPSQHPPTAGVLSTAHSLGLHTSENTPHTAQAPQPLHERSGLPTAEDALSVTRTHSPPHTHTQSHARPLRSRAHTSTHTQSHISLSITFFFFFPPPDGSCRVGGPAALGGKFPGRGRYYQLPGAHLAFRREAIGGGCPTPKAARGATQSPEAPRK